MAKLVLHLFSDGLAQYCVNLSQWMVLHKILAKHIMALFGMLFSSFVHMHN